LAFLSTENNPIFVGLGIDGRVLGFTALLAVGTCLLFGLLPAWRATRLGAFVGKCVPVAADSTAGRERFVCGGRLSWDKSRSRWYCWWARSCLSASLQNLLSVDAGFRPEGVIAVSLDLRRPSYKKDRRPRSLPRSDPRFKTLPGVLSAAQVSIVPVSRSGGTIVSARRAPLAKGVDSNFNRVSPGYFRTMSTALLAGRDFDDRDTLNAPKVAGRQRGLCEESFSAEPIRRPFFPRGRRGGQARPCLPDCRRSRNTKYYELGKTSSPSRLCQMAQEDDPGSGVTFVLRTSGFFARRLHGVKSSGRLSSPRDRNRIPGADNAVEGVAECAKG